MKAEFPDVARVGGRSAGFTNSQIAIGFSDVIEYENTSTGLPTLHAMFVCVCEHVENVP